MRSQELSLSLCILSAALLSLTTLSACTDDRSTSSRLSVATTSGTDLTPEQEWLHKLQLITVLTSSGADGGAGDLKELSASEFDAAVAAECPPRLRQPDPAAEEQGPQSGPGGAPPPPPLPDNSLCVATLNGISLSICEAKMLLAAATVQADPLVFSKTGYSVPQQSEEASEALAEEAVTDAWDATTKAEQALTDPSLAPCLVMTNGTTGQSVTTATTFTSAYAEAYETGKDAYKRAIEATLNASDKMRSSSLSPLQAGARSIAGEKLSRAAAAHLIVGGDPGLNGTSANPLCLHSDLTPESKTALQIFRDAAVDPRDVVNDGPAGVSIASLVNGSLPQGSVRQRLFQFHGYQELSTGGQTVEQFYKLNIANFQAARDAMREEIITFGRSSAAQLDGTGTFKRYAGTATVPRELPPAAWSALASFYASPRVTPSLPTVTPLALFLDEAHWDAARFLQAEDALPESIRAQAAAPMAMILAGKEVLGEFTFFRNSDNTNRVDADAAGFTKEDRLRIVVGEEGLRCAVQGTIEGAQCNDALPAAPYPCSASAQPSLSCLTLVRMNAETGTFGLGKYEDIVADLSVPPPTGSHLYLVRPRDAGAPESPGQFEVLAGFRMPANGAGAIAAIAPSLDQRVAEVLAPDKKYCALPEVSCGKVRMDARLPLEDELVDDNNGVEDSWKHYLNLAQQAATEADTLGQDYINTKLNLSSAKAENEIRREEQRQRAEEALQRVQSSCGTAIDSQRLLTLLSGGDSGQLTQSTLDQACDCPNCQACTGNYSCLAGRCAVDFSKIAASDPTDPDLARLNNCLASGPDTVYPFVTLGDQPLCVTVGPTPIDVCKAGGDCPYVQPQTGCTSASDKVATPLRIFTTPNDTITTDTCKALNVLRTTRDTKSLDSLVHSGILHPTRVASSVGVVTVEALYGGYATVSYDYVPHYSTGSVESGPATQWPCIDPRANPALPANCMRDGTALSGLFCTYTPCDHGHDQQRAQLNDRLLRAAIAADVMLYAGFGYDWPQIWNQHLGPFMVPMKSLDHFTTEKMTIEFEHDSGSPVNDRSIDNRPDDKSFWGPVNGHSMWGTDQSTRAITAWQNWDSSSSPGVFTQYTAIGRDNAFRFWEEDANVSAGEGSFSQFNAPAYFWSQLSGFVGAPGGFAWVARILQVGEDPNGRNGPSVKYHFDTNSLAHSSGAPLSSGGTLDGQSFLDGLELLCDATEAKITGATAKPAGIETFEDIGRAGAYLKGLSTAIERQGARMVFANIPKIAVDSGHDTNAIGVVPALSGAMADAVISLRSAELQAKNALPTIAGEMNQFAAELHGLSAALEKNDDLAELRSVQLESTVLDRVTQCGNSILSIDDAASFGAKAVVNCANSIAQIALAAQINDLANQAAQKDELIQKADFGGHAAGHARALQAAALALGEAAEAIDKASADIDGLKKAAQVELARAVYLASWQSQQEVQYITSLGALSTEKKVRYSMALANARLMADLAKRSIEQRLGVRLSEMRTDLPLVEAPQKWEGKACTMSGIDYDKLATNPGNFSDGFIGDYVTKLSNLVEGYRIENNFHEGSDTAVISLRDDVFNVRKDCEVPANNLLLESAALDRPRWQATGCAPVVSNGVTETAMNCVAAIPTTDSPFPTFNNQLTGARGYALRFGDGNGCQAPLTSGPCGWQSGAALSQSVLLSNGNYRLSWYTQESGNQGGAQAASIIGPSGNSLSLAYDDLVLGTAAAWNRASATFSVTVPGTYAVGFRLPGATMPAANYKETIGAVMLELLPANDTSVPLPSYQRTDETNLVKLAACEDTNGEIFRLSQWQPECVHLCDAGFSNNCTDGPTKCYREASFGVSQSALENGKLFNFSGFARGNFNYRINTVALNFVGTGIRDCSNSALPNACSGGGFATYSFDHTGPFFVRNFDGAESQAFLFDGHIEQARGLATERYITNPISTSDKDLLSNYMRAELRGRPLDGNFTIRIWDDDAVNFDAIQDVQVILNYSYWTRFK